MCQRFQRRVKTTPPPPPKKRAVLNPFTKRHVLSCAMSVLLRWFWNGSLLASAESDDSHGVRIQVNCLQQWTLHSLFLFFSSDPCDGTLSSTVVLVAHLAKSARRNSITGFFLRAYDPFTHACEARPLTDVGPALLVPVKLPPSLPLPPTPTLFPQSLWSRKAVARPSFSITEDLQVVPKHLRKCCQAFSFQLMTLLPVVPKKTTTC